MRICPFVLLLIFTMKLSAQNKLPVMQSSKALISVRDGNVYLPNYWTISPEIKPDTWEVIVPAHTTKRIAFITDCDSITFSLALHKSIDFIIVLNGKDSAYTRVTALPESATFSEAYKQKYTNRILAEVPETYELMNIAIALTKKGLADSNLVNHETAYYQDFLQWFTAYKNEKIVTMLDSALTQSYWMYTALKMDSYAFNFRRNHIERSQEYDRISWGKKNTLAPFIGALNAFAQKSGFRKFYSAHKKFYSQQTHYFTDSLGLKKMTIWLHANFPGTSYSSFKVIFSPLVMYSQSANWFGSGNFKEVQAHVNFPYPDASDKKYSQVANLLRAGVIVFTELNHSFINPELMKYSSDTLFTAAFKDLHFWESENSYAAQGYSNAYMCFNEYMNWALVSLWYLDFAPVDEVEKMISTMESAQQKLRGFKLFPAFNRNLISLYKSRAKGKTIADIYPAILTWCYHQVQRGQ